MFLVKRFDFFMWVCVLIRNGDVGLCDFGKVKVGQRQFRVDFFYDGDSCHYGYV